MTINQLPKDILKEIFKYLPFRNQLAVRIINKAWKTAMDEIPSETNIITKIVAGEGYSIIINKTGNVFTFGKNTYGKLGHGNTDNYLKPTQINPVHFSHSRIVNVAVGENYTVFLGEDGKVFTCGWAKDGRLGRSNKNCLIPGQIDLANFKGSKIISVAAGKSHTIFLGEDGKVFTCGEGLGGKLGHAGKTINFSRPAQINPDYFYGNRIMNIAAGENHSIFLADEGNVFTCGQGEHGKLGHNNENHHFIPTKINLGYFKGSKIISVAAGKSHTIFLGEDGKVFTCGEGLNGKLGHGDEKNCLIPTQINPDYFKGYKIISIAANARHTMLLAKSGTVFSFGDALHGKLGHGKNTRTGYFIPTQINPDYFKGGKIINIATGAFHTLFLEESGNIFSCGFGKTGALGHNNEEVCTKPTRIEKFYSFINTINEIDEAISLQKKLLKILNEAQKKALTEDSVRSGAFNEDLQIAINHLSSSASDLIVPPFIPLFDNSIDKGDINKAINSQNQVRKMLENKQKEEAQKKAQKVLTENSFQPAVFRGLQFAINHLSPSTPSFPIKPPFAPLFNAVNRVISEMEHKNIEAEIVQVRKKAKITEKQ